MVDIRFFADNSGVNGTVYGMQLDDMIVESWAPHIDPPKATVSQQILIEQAAKMMPGNCVHLDDWGARTVDQCTCCSARAIRRILKEADEWKL